MTTMESSPSGSVASKSRKPSEHRAGSSNPEGQGLRVEHDRPAWLFSESELGQSRKRMKGPAAHHAEFTPVPPTDALKTSILAFPG